MGPCNKRLGLVGLIQDTTEHEFDILEGVFRGKKMCSVCRMVLQNQHSSCSGLTLSSVTLKWTFGIPHKKYLPSYFLKLFEFI